RLTPGANVTITGSGFSTTRTSNTVTIGGIAAAVRSAATTQISATVATTGYLCAPTRDVQVTVTVNGESGTQLVPLQVAQRRTLAEGQAIVVSDPAQSQCNELVPATGRYVVAVFNPSTAPTPVAFTLRGAQSAVPPTPDPTPAASSRIATRIATHNDQSEGDVLALALSTTLRLTPRVTPRAPNAARSARSAAVAVGD